MEHKLYYLNEDEERGPIRTLLLQMSDGDERGDAYAGELMEAIRARCPREACKETALALVFVNDWNDDLSPWPAPAVFRPRDGAAPDDFGGRGEETLRELLDTVIPDIRAEAALADDVRLCLGGYSLGGFFALWAGTRTDIFRAVVGASPSVWFPKWDSYRERHPYLAKKVYLSLGDKEEKTRNPVMATVGDRIRREAQMAASETEESILEWNEGNHFRDAALRLAKGYAWILR